MNWVTIALLAAIAFVTWRAYANGFIRELVSLCVVILAIPLAGIFHDDMIPKVEPIVDNANLAALVSFLAILIGVIIAGQVIGHLLKATVAMLNLGVLDKIAGGAFGFLKAVIVAQVLLIVLVRYPNPNLKDDIDASPLATALLDAAPIVLAFLPGTFENALDLFLEGAGRVDDALPSPTPRP